MKHSYPGSGKRLSSEMALAGVLLSLASTPGVAQQANCPLGSPCATTTLSGKQLPSPAPKFEGVIKDDALQSKAWWPPRVVPPKGAPNILLIMTDDAGFGVPSTFGGVIPTPSRRASPPIFRPKMWCRRWRLFWRLRHGMLPETMPPAGARIAEFPSAYLQSDAEASSLTP